MPCETKRRDIDGHKYAVRQMPPSVAVGWEVEILMLLGEVVPPFVRVKREGTLEAVASAIKDVAAVMRKQVGPERFAEIVVELTTSNWVWRDGEHIKFDRDFAGPEAVTKYKLLLFVLEVNFLHFLDGSGLKDAATEAVNQAMTGSGTAPPTSTSDSGDPA